LFDFILKKKEEISKQWFIKLTNLIFDQEQSALMHYLLHRKDG
jgi:hypothetical protein